LPLGFAAYLVLVDFIETSPDPSGGTTIKRRSRALDHAVHQGCSTVHGKARRARRPRAGRRRRRAAPLSAAGPDRGFASCGGAQRCHCGGLWSLRSVTASGPNPLTGSEVSDEGPNRADQLGRF